MYQDTEANYKAIRGYMHILFAKCAESKVEVFRELESPLRVFMYNVALEMFQSEKINKTNSTVIVTCLLARNLKLEFTLDEKGTVKGLTIIFHQEDGNRTDIMKRFNDEFKQNLMKWVEDKVQDQEDIFNNTPLAITVITKFEELRKELTTLKEQEKINTLEVKSLLTKEMLKTLEAVKK